MEFKDLPRRHDLFTEAMTRNPGTPPSQCQGRLIRVDPEHREIPWDSPGVWDDVASGEGEIGQMAETFLALCECDHNSLVSARCPDGTWRLRNTVPDWKSFGIT